MEARDRRAGVLRRARHAPRTFRWLTTTPVRPTQLVAASSAAGCCKPLLENEQLAKIGHRPQVRRARAEARRHRAARHALRLDARVVRLEQHGDAPRARRSRAEVSRRRPDPLRRPDRHAARSRSRSARSPIDSATKYAAENADIVAAAASRAVAEDRRRAAAAVACTRSIEQPLVPVLLRMEHARRAHRRRAAAAAEPRAGARACANSKRSAHAAAGGPFSLESPKQLQEVLFGKLGLPVLRKTPTGQPSTAEDVLEELAEKYELPRLIMDYRALREAQVHVHGQAAAADQPRPRDACTPAITRRSRRPVGCRRSIRTCRTFRSARRRAGASARPSSRRRAGASSPPTIRRSSCGSWRTCPATTGLLNAFAEDRDIHQATAAEVFGMPLEQVTRGPAALREDDQLRPDLRHVRVRPRRAARHRAQRGADATSSCISSAIRACVATWRKRASRRASAAMSRRYSAGASI